MDHNIIKILAVLVLGVAGFIVLERTLEQLENRVTGQGRSGCAPK